MLDNKNACYSENINNIKFNNINNSKIPTNKCLNYYENSNNILKFNNINSYEENKIYKNKQI